MAARRILAALLLALTGAGAAAQTQPVVPMLFVTGNCPAQAGAPLALGCLHKPFDELQLLAAVAIAGRLIRGEPVDPATLPSGLHLYDH